MIRYLSLLAAGVALSACSSSGDLMRTATPTVPLQFESEPPGAEVKTSGGQTCKTPCALAVPAADFQATFSLNGYTTQNVPVKLLPPEDIRGNEEAGMTGAPPRFTPSPVAIEMQRAAPPRRAPAKKPRVARQPPAEQPAQAAAPRPQRAQPQQTQQQPAQQQPPSGGFSPPPSTSGFNPPPQNSGFGQPQSAPSSGAWPAPQSR